MRNNLSEHIETKAEQAPKEPKAKKGSKAFVQILNGEFLSREFIIENLGFIFLLNAAFASNCWKRLLRKATFRRCAEQRKTIGRNCF